MNIYIIFLYLCTREIVYHHLGSFLADGRCLEVAGVQGVVVAQSNKGKTNANGKQMKL